MSSDVSNIYIRIPIYILICIRKISKRKENDVVVVNWKYMIANRYDNLKFVDLVNVKWKADVYRAVTVYFQIKMISQRCVFATKFQH